MKAPELIQEHGRIVAIRCPHCQRVGVCTRAWLRASLGLRQAVAPGETALTCLRCSAAVEASLDIVAEAARLDADYERFRSAPPPMPWSARAGGAK